MSLTSTKDSGLDLFLNDDILLELLVEVIELIIAELVVPELVEVLLLLLRLGMNMSLDEVQVSSNTSSQTSKMLATWSVQLPSLASRASNSDFLPVAGLEAEGIHIVSTSTMGLDDELSIVKLDA